MILQDGYFSSFFPPHQEDFYQVEFSQSVFESPSFWGELVNFYIRFDQRYDNYERSIYGFGNLLENIGGFYSSIIALGMIIVPFFSERLFYSSLINKIY